MTWLKWLISGVKAGDRLLFHYSGHSSQIVDRDGDELPDKMDEIICLHDMDWDVNFISDDDLRALFTDLPKGVNPACALDSCYSGLSNTSQNTLGIRRVISPAPGSSTGYRHLEDFFAWVLLIIARNYFVCIRALSKQGKNYL